MSAFQSPDGSQRMDPGDINDRRASIITSTCETGAYMAA